MGLPKNIKFGGMLYAVKKMALENARYVGHISYDAEIIEVKKGLSRQNEAQVVIHEIIHGLLTHGGDTEISGDEHFVDRFAYAMHALIVDNPKLVDHWRSLSE